MSSDKPSDNNTPNSQQSSSNTENSTKPTNVINLFTRESVASGSADRSLRIAPETYGRRMLYATHDNPDRLVAVPILCWALKNSGEIAGIVPWLDEMLSCEEIEEKYSVSWEGFYCTRSESIFYEAPEDVAAQLITAARFPLPSLGELEITAQDDTTSSTSVSLVQEIPDTAGTHALLVSDNSDALLLTSVISWALDEQGYIHGMLADDNQIEKLPVLPGDDCLYSAVSAESFKCYFQRDIAEQIRTQNPETLEAIEQLFAN